MATTPVAVAKSTVPILSHWIDGRPVEVPPEGTAPVFDPATGAGFDGLEPDGVNRNERAESTLAFVGTMLQLR